MTIDRDEYEPAPLPPLPSTLPPGLRARLTAVGRDLAGLAASLSRHVDQEEARLDRRRQRREESRSTQKGASGR